MVKTKAIPTGPQHEQLRLELIALVRRKAADMPADEILAVVSVLVGQLIAMQDQRCFTSEAIMALVSSNIEAGNRMAVNNLFNAKGGHA